MRFFLLALLFSVLIAPCASAQTGADDEAPAPDGKAAAPRAEIITDEEAGIIRFIVDGAEMMRVDAQGLHVDGAVSADKFVSAGQITGRPRGLSDPPAATGGTKGGKP